MLRRQRLAVHLIDQQDLVAHRFADRETALVKLNLFAFDALIEAGKNNLDSGATEAGVLQDSSERRARPFGVTDRFEKPWLADAAGREKSSAVAGTLHGDGHG